jgi:hypothetical protein
MQPRLSQRLQQATLATRSTIVLTLIDQLRK